MNSSLEESSSKMQPNQHFQFWLLRLLVLLYCRATKKMTMMKWAAKSDVLVAVKLDEMREDCSALVDVAAVVQVTATMVAPPIAGTDVTVGRSRTSCISRVTRACKSLVTP